MTMMCDMFELSRTPRGESVAGWTRRFTTRFNGVASLVLCPHPFELHRAVNEIVATRTAHLFQVAPVNGKQTTLHRSILVDAAARRAVLVAAQKGALEEYFATRTATVALAAPRRERGARLLCPKMSVNEAAKLALRLTRAEFGIFHGAQPLDGGKPRLDAASRGEDGGFVHRSCRAGEGEERSSSP